MDTCFVLNFGYEAPLVWPQVKVLFYEGSLVLVKKTFNKQVRIKLDTEDTGNALHLVSETYGMDVPSACTIVIIAGNLLDNI